MDRRLPSTLSRLQAVLKIAIWVCAHDYQHDGIHLYLIQQVFCRYSGTRLENDLMQQKSNLFFIANANQLCKHIMSLSLLQTKCSVIRSGGFPTPTLASPHGRVLSVMDHSLYVFMCILHGPPAAKFRRCNFLYQETVATHIH